MVGWTVSSWPYLTFAVVTRASWPGLAPPDGQWPLWVAALFLFTCYDTAPLVLNPALGTPVKSNDPIDVPHHLLIRSIDIIFLHFRYVGLSYYATCLAEKHSRKAHLHLRHGVITTARRSVLASLLHIMLPIDSSRVPSDKVFSLCTLTNNISFICSRSPEWMGGDVSSDCYPSGSVIFFCRLWSLGTISVWWQPAASLLVYSPSRLFVEHPISPWDGRHVCLDVFSQYDDIFINFLLHSNIIKYKILHSFKLFCWQSSY